MLGAMASKCWIIPAVWLMRRNRHGSYLRTSRLCLTVTVKGYTVQRFNVRASECGLPQNRLRAFQFGYQSGSPLVIRPSHRETDHGNRCLSQAYATFKGCDTAGVTLPRQVTCFARAMNDLYGAPEPSTNPAEEAISRAGETVFARHGSASPSATADGMAALQTPALPANVDLAAAQANRDFFRKTALSVLRFTDGIVQRKLKGRIERLPAGASPDYARKLAETAAMPPEDAEQMAELAMVVADKYGLTFKYAPEFALAVFCATYLGGIAAVITELRGLETVAKN